MRGHMMARLIIPFPLFDDQPAPVHIFIHRIRPTDIVRRQGKERPYYQYFECKG